MTLRRSLLPVAVVLLVACPKSILPLYEKTRTNALADPGAAPDAWKPDVVLHLTPKMVEQTVRLLLEDHGTVAENIEVMGARLTPRFTVNALRLASSDSCKDCLAVGFDLGGKLSWQAPLLGKGSAPITAKGAFDVQLELTEDKGVWTATLKPRDLRQLTVDVGGEHAQVKGLAEGPIKNWVEKNLIRRIPPATVGKFGSPKELPLRGVRVLDASKGLRIGMLTTSSTSAPVPLSEPEMGTDWQVDISQDSLAGLAAAEAFQQGPVAYDVVGQPTRLQLGAEHFEMGLRLWRIQGKGWWRDYTVNGDVALDGGKIRLKASDVVEGEKSPGAALVDPLAALGEGIILKAMEDNIKFALPSAHATNLAGHPTRFAVEKLDGGKGAFSVGGSFVVDRPPRPPEPPEEPDEAPPPKGGKVGKAGKAKLRHH